MPGISEILAFLDAQGVPYPYRGDRELRVNGFSSLSNYRSGSFTWVKRQENIPAGMDPSQVRLAFVSEGVAAAFPNVIESPESKRAFFSAIEHFYAQEEERPAVGAFTYIGPCVRLGEGVRIGHNCTLDGDIRVGSRTVIWHNVVILNRVEIGSRCEIQSGAVIGHDGFGYSEDAGHNKHMVRHFGGVRIGDDVLLGSGARVCRGTIDDTVIESGAKIDNLCHIAHNCVVGKRAGMAYPCALGGSSRVGDEAYLAACVVRNQHSVGDGAFVGMGAVVVRDVEANQTVAGNPAKPFPK